MATGGKGAGDDRSGVPGEGAKTLSGSGRPQFDRVVARAAQNSGAIGSKGAGPNCVAMPSKLALQLVSRGVEESQIAATTN